MEGDVGDGGGDDPNRPDVTPTGAPLAVAGDVAVGLLDCRAHCPTSMPRQEGYRSGARGSARR
jgi:hypothetical protein